MKNNIIDKLVETLNPPACQDAAGSLPDAPYGPKIASITAKGIEFYWKKIEISNGYEIFRANSAQEEYVKIGDAKRNVGVFVDSKFDRNSKEIFYKCRSFVRAEDGTRCYSEFTKPVSAAYREEMTLERDTTYMYDGTARKFKIFQGWGEVPDASWSSANPQIASVTQDGTVSAHQTGEAVLTCSSEALNRSVSCRIVVNRKSLAPLDVGPRRYTLNLQTLHWENPQAEASNEATIMMVGDMMCGANQTKRQYTEANGWSFNDSYEYVKLITAKSDFAVGNLETLMAPGFPYMIDETYINNTNNCNNPSRYLDAVLYGGFDGVLMSNNHNCDGGTRALLETIQEVKLRNIPFTGIFSDSTERRFQVVNIRGIRVGFLAYTSSFTGFNKKDQEWTQEERDTYLNVFSKERALRDIQDCKAAGAEYIIAYMHWGNKNYRAITNAQAQEAQEAADAGIDFIVGANPHIVQVYDTIVACDGRKVPCYYSTGNFHAYMNQIPGNRDSILVRVQLKRDENGKVCLARHRYIPFHTFKEKHGCYLVPLAASEKYHTRIMVPGRMKYFKRIQEAVGPKAKAL